MMDSIQDMALKEVWYRLDKLILGGMANVREQPGIYLWHIRPDFASKNARDLLAKIEEASHFEYGREEQLSNKSYKVAIQERTFPKPDFFGLSANKQEKFRNIIERADRKQMQNIQKHLDYIFTFARPLYVGKADNMRARVGQHIDRQTKLLDWIFSLPNTKQSQVWLEARYIHHEILAELNDIFEEILQRIVRPRFVGRVG